MKIKQKILSVVLAATMASSLFTPEMSKMLGAGYSTADAASTADIAIPTPNIKSGTYALSSSSMKVKLSCATPNAKIYYSLNGAKYALYSSANPISITKNSTLKVYARTSSGYSYAKTYKYKITPKVKITPNSGTYSGTKTVSVTTTCPNTYLYYTTDGTTPTTSSPRLYSTTKIKITKNTTFKVLVAKSNWQSYIYTRTYKINTPAASNVSILDDYTKKWAYNTLTDKQKKAYAAILEGALKTQKTISLYDLDITQNDLNKAFWACDYDNPKLLNIKNGFNNTYSGTRIYDLNIIYSKTASQTATALANVEAKTADIIAEAKKLKTDYDKVKLFHDWIINHTTYTLTGDKYISETDGPILYGKALCEGYSRAFQYLCQSVGIECVCISGTGNGGGHMWNMVKVNGKWYHIDVTWDDPISPDGRPLLKYDYFLLSDSQIKKDHVINNKFTIPTAPSAYTG